MKGNKMKTQPINHSTPMAFKGYRRDASTMSKALFDTVKEYPVVKTFGDKFDATMSVRSFGSSKNPLRSQLSLVLEDIKPATLLGKAKSLFVKPRYESIALKTRATNEEDFITEIANQHSNSLFMIYKK